MSITVADPILSISSSRKRQRAHAAPPVKRPVSAARVEANRRNALKSTGPRSVEGKKRSSRNALKHGLRAQSVFTGLPASMSFSPVLPGECAGTYDTIKQELREEFHPRTAMENWLIDGIATQLWRLMRTNDIERRMLEAEGRRVTLERYEAAKDANGEDAVMTPASVLAGLFDTDRASGVMLVARYQGQMQRLMLRMLLRLEALRKRTNDDLYSFADRQAAKYPGHSQTFQRTGWPAEPLHPVPTIQPPPPMPVAQSATALEGDSSNDEDAGVDEDRPSPHPSPSGLGEGVRERATAAMHKPGGSGQDVGCSDVQPVETADKRTHSNPSRETEKLLWHAANAVRLPVLNEKSDRTKPAPVPASPQAA